MATFQFPARRLIIAGGFAVAVAAAPAIAVFAVPTAGTSAPVAQCPGGEEADQFTGVCVPHTVPNSPFSPIAGNPSIPAIGGIPCTGANTGQCIGLGEEQQAMGPQPVPRSTISSSP
jgi:hypothetical protein